MAQGKKYNTDVKEKAFALLACNNSVAAVAKEMKLPYTTVKTWEKQYLAQSEKIRKKEAEKASESGDEVCFIYGEKDLVKLRQHKKEEFVEKAWSIIERAQALLFRRVDRALKEEEKIDKAVSEITDIDGNSLTQEQKNAFYRKISAIKVEDVGKVATVIGTMYDKQALALGDSTVNPGGVTLEELVKGLTGKGEY